MGGGYYDRQVYSSQGGGAANDVVGKVSSINPGLDPKKFIQDQGGIQNDNLNPIVFALDVTGSMGEWPKIIYDKMPMFYGQIKMKNYLTDPAISFCAIGDATCDSAPLQVTRFGQGKQIDEMIAKLWLEGGGGGGFRESYELPAYFYNHYVKLTNAQIPFFFVTGDEAFYDQPLSKDYLKVLGEEPKKEVRAAVEWAEIRKNYNVFLLKKQYSTSSQEQIYNQWKGALGGHERILKTKTPKACIDIILGAIALTSGVRTLKQYVADMEQRGQSKQRIQEVTQSLQRYSKALQTKKIIPINKKAGVKIVLPPAEYKVQLNKMAEEEKGHITQSFFCPLTKQIFVDPVMASDGNTYERKAIADWLKTKDTSPVTAVKLQNKELFPNLAVQKHIYELYSKWSSKQKPKA